MAVVGGVLTDVLSPSQEGLHPVRVGVMRKCKHVLVSTR